MGSLSWGQKTLLALGVFVLTFILSLAAVTAVLVRLPSTCFREDFVWRLASQHPIIRWVGARRDADAGGDMGPGRFPRFPSETGTPEPFLT